MVARKGSIGSKVRTWLNKNTDKVKSSIAERSYVKDFISGLNTVSSTNVFLHVEKRIRGDK